MLCNEVARDGGLIPHDVCLLQRVWGDRERDGHVRNRPAADLFLPSPRNQLSVRRPPAQHAFLAHIGPGRHGERGAETSNMTDWI